MTPIRISCGSSGIELKEGDAGRLGLPAVVAAYERLGFAPCVSTPAWGLSRASHLAHGHSGQLAALLALVKAQHLGCELRHAIGRDATVWASARITADLRLERPVLESVGGPVGSGLGAAFDEKVQAFLKSRAWCFVCAEDDANRVRDRIVPREQIVSLDALDARLEAGELGAVARLVVAVRAWELARLVRLLFDGIAPEKADATVLAIRVRQGADVDAVIRRVASAPRVMEVHFCEGDRASLVVAVFRSLDEAFLQATAMSCDADMSASAQLALRSGRLDWDRRGPRGPLFREALELAVVASSGVVAVTASEITQLRDGGRPPRGWLLGREGRSGALGGVDVYALSAAPDTPTISLDALSGQPRSTLAVIIACGLTLSRLPLGLIAAGLIAEARYGVALRVYVAGIITDVLDGFIARQLNGETAWGKRYDGVLDTAFYWIATIGFVVGGMARGDPLVRAALPLLLVLATLAVTFWFEPYSEFYKYRSLVNRCWVVWCILPRLAWNESDVTLVVMLGLIGLIGGIYEWRVTQEEIASGRRGRGWRRSPVAPLAAYHRVLVRLQRATSTIGDSIRYTKSHRRINDEEEEVAR